MSDQPRTPAAEPLEIHIFADSTGESGARLARAAVAQFPHREFRLVRHRRVTSADRMRFALARLQERQGKPTAVFMTLVNPDLTHLVEMACDELGMPCVDLLGGVMASLERISGEMADEVPMRPVNVEADYFTRVAAIDFAVRNDDGASPSTLREADICLVGPSRSGKTPLSIYLAYLGYRVVNVPLVPGIAPPPELFTVDRWRIVGLTIDPERLQMLRGERVKVSGVRTTMQDGYADLAAILGELDEVRSIQRRLGCPVVDTTGIALEESAAKIIDLVEDRAARFGGELRRPAGLDSPLPTGE